MDGDVAEKIIEQLEALCPLEALNERRAWRDKRLIELSELKKRLYD